MTKSLLPKGEVARRIQEIRAAIAEEAAAAGRDPAAVSLMAVTKTVPAGNVREAVLAGADLLGESRVQEFREKSQFYRCRWEKIHFIGHLQTNKIRDIISRIGCIESLDSMRLAEALDRQAGSAKQAGSAPVYRQIPVFLQVNIGAESTKSGFLPEELDEAARRIAELPNLSIQGLMAIPPKDGGDVWFGRMRELSERLSALSIPGADFSELSMGMSADFRAAVRFGATIVRIGSGIFGPRG